MNPTNALESILHNFRTVSTSPREMGTYFEELVLLFLKHEPAYKDLYSDVWNYSDWAMEFGKDARDVGIDLVARTEGTQEFHAIQCKFYEETYKVQKADIDSFFTASGQKPFVHRVIVSTTNNWSEHAESALSNQTPPVTRIDLYHLQNSVIDWSKFKSKTKPVLKTKKELRKYQSEAVKDVLKAYQRRIVVNSSWPVVQERHLPA
jgi:predicted helicase